mmetsp:Transcript_7456/g.16608  ORF Transcript_7456/g.16608 Transcript_7456/m.16608 type:complete len:93 (-) Transcript_7456:617-895(-)
MDIVESSSSFDTAFSDHNHIFWVLTGLQSSIVTLKCLESSCSSGGRPRAALLLMERSVLPQYHSYSTSELRDEALLWEQQRQHPSKRQWATT